jgi:hypothetical protein
MRRRADKPIFQLKVTLLESQPYEYDFGDGWDHEVKVEKALRFEPCMAYPVCTAGARACPPEDSGGVLGYEDFLAALADPRHPRHEELCSWIGGVFDPKGFDLNRVNAAFRGIRSIPGL